MKLIGPYSLYPGTIRIAGQKTFTGAANLGAVGDCPIFTTTGAVMLRELFVRCTTDLNDTVDGALFTIGVTGSTAFFGDFTGAFDLDTIDAGDCLNFGAASAVDGVGNSAPTGNGASGALVVVDNITMTVSAQAITSGVLEFYALYQSLSSDGALSLGTGMVAI